ncbi:MAG TPA: HNH endonuclease [Desulfobacterales bacterium]
MGKKRAVAGPGPYAYDLEETDIRRERDRARALRQSQWWKRRLAKGVCQYCGCSVPPGDLTMDHIVPIARGGRTTRGNVVAACKACNRKKKQMLPTEWAAYLESMRNDSEKAPDSK